MRRSTSQRPGAAGEEIACRHLERQGLTILARNVRYRFGEIDIVADDHGTLVFVEVKERTGTSHGMACEAVTFGKRQRIVRAAQAYASSRRGDETPIRFDVVAIDRAGDGTPQVRHDRGAFDADGK